MLLTSRKELAALNPVFIVTSFGAQRAEGFFSTHCLSNDAIHIFGESKPEFTAFDCKFRIL
jgi:hypothetical protein